MSVKREVATMMVRKVNNAKMGVIVNESKRGLWLKGDEYSHAKFRDYPRNTLLRVLVTVTPSGRKFIDGISVDKKPGESGPIALAEELADALGAKAVEDAALERALKGTIFHPKVTWMEPPAEVEEKIVMGLVTGRIYTKKEKETIMATPKSLVDGYYISAEARLQFNIAVGMSAAAPERAVKVMMVGQSGYGKTTLPKLVADLVGKRFMRMNCATIRDPEEWFGYREAREGSTVFIHSEFGKAIQEGNLVVVLDEFNRLEPWLHNTLFPLLDDDGCTTVHDEQFSIGPGVIVVGTINTGHKFTGTFELDEALMNRFDFVLEVGPMPHGEETKVLRKRTGVDSETATTIVKMANVLRNSEVICSTRTTLLIARMFVSGMTLREAFDAAVIRRVPVDTSGSGLRKQVVDLVNGQLGAQEARTLSNDIFSKGGYVEVTTEVEQIAPATKTSVLKLHQNEEKTLDFITLVKTIRLLPVTGLGDGELMALNTAHSFAQQIRNGEEIEIFLRFRPSGEALDNLIEAMRACGVSGRLTKGN